MSMLAERKIKQKWSLNPRGKAWAQDSNKFGQKMLEKMGWQNGKGLGPNGKGITEHIKIAYKNDSKGMGYKESDSQWTEHEDNFTSLLNSLSGTVEKSDELKLTSLEKKSQTSRARVHYHKFTRGKDLSRYSEKDLANIFGKKTLVGIKKETKEEQSDGNEEKTKSESAFLLNAGSMRDYFKKKLPNFSNRTNGYEVGHNGVLKRRDSESESEVAPSFGFGYKQKDDLDQSNSHQDFTIKSEATSDEKFPENLPTSGKGTFISYVNTNEVLVVHTKKNKNKRKGEECNEESVLSPKKKSKRGDEDTPKKKSKIKLDEDMGLSNPAFNPLCTPVKVQRHILNTIQESISELEDNSPEIIEVEAEVYDDALKKKNEVEERSGTLKKKKKSQKFEEIVTEICSSEEKKKAKKKKNIVNGFVNNVVVEDIEDTPKKKKPEIGMENPVFNTSIESDCCAISGENLYEVSIKEKKKKKKEIKMAIDNPNFVDSEESIESLQTEENPYEVKVKEKKKKKKQKPFEIENPNFNDTLENPLNSSINSSQFEANSYEVQVKEKKKKLKKEKFAQENPNFNGSIENSTDSSQIEENPYEVKIKKKSKKTNQQKMKSSVDSVQVEENTFEITDKKKKNKNKELFAVDNPYFDPNDSVQIDIENNVFEVERKKKKIKKNKEDRGIVNPGLNLDVSESENKEIDSIEIEESDIMLNVVTTPIIAKPKTLYKENTLSITKVNSVKRTKSVRFSDVTQERIIPNNDDLRNMSEIEIESEIFPAQVNGNIENENSSAEVSPLNEENQSKRGKKRKLGLDNAAFDKQKNTLEENLDSISKTIDMYQAEIENDINEKKLETFQMEDIMVGEVGNPHGENERVTEGIKLKFKYAHFQSKLPFYQLDKTGSKKSYKHLIKGDIVLKFKDSNLHEIKGYAIKKKNTT